MTVKITTDVVEDDRITDGDLLATYDRYAGDDGKTPDRDEVINAIDDYLDEGPRSITSRADVTRRS